MSTRSRHTVVVAVTLGYVLAWGVGVAVGLAAMSIVDHQDGGDDSFAALGMLILGFLVGVLLGHVTWIVVAVRLLRPFGHPWSTTATVVLTPVAMVVLMIVINEVEVPWQLWPVTAVAVPAVLASWATRPRSSPTPTPTAADA